MPDIWTCSPTQKIFVLFQSRIVKGENEHPKGGICKKKVHAGVYFGNRKVMEKKEREEKEKGREKTFLKKIHFYATLSWFGFHKLKIFRKIFILLKFHEICTLGWLFCDLHARQLRNYLILCGFLKCSVFQTYLKRKCV